MSRSTPRKAAKAAQRERMPTLCGGSRRVHARGRREPIPGGSGRGVHAAHGPAHEPGANRRCALAAQSRVAFALLWQSGVTHADSGHVC